MTELEGRIDLEDLRQRVWAWRGDPTEPPPDAVRWAYLSALLSRLDAAPPARQAVLARKLQQGLEMGAKAASSGVPAPEHAFADDGPLQALNREHQAQLQARSGAPMPQAGPLELFSATRFRDTWALVSAETEVDVAAFRAPKHAGPLNAHRLVLKVLAEMRQLSPDYLRHCLAHVDTVMWLDQAANSLGGGQRAKTSKAANKSANKAARKTGRATRKT